jgi:hypothetical protein
MKYVKECPLAYFNTERLMKIQENTIGKPAAKRQRKTLLARDLAIMISKSLLLFNKVAAAGKNTGAQR